MQSLIASAPFPSSLLSCLTLFLVYCELNEYNTGHTVEQFHCRLVIATENESDQELPSSEQNMMRPLDMAIKHSGRNNP